MKEHFTSREVVALTGITPAPVAVVGRAPHRRSRREGHRRLYSNEDLAEVAVICELRRRGFSLQRVRKVMRFLQREFSKRLAETVTGSSDYHLLTDGRTLVSGNVGPADRGHPEEFPSAHADGLSQRHRAPDSRRSIRNAEKKLVPGAAAPAARRKVS